MRKFIKMLTSWSFSRFNDYEKCPFLAKCKHVDRLREPPSPVLEHGSDVHKEAELFVRGEIKKLPPSLAAFPEQFKELKKEKATTEHEWAFTRDWKITYWKDWTGCWLRMKVDVFRQDQKDSSLGFVIDHKTGKEHDEHVYQRELYAIGAFISHPELEQVIVEHWYLDTGKKQRSTFKRKELQKLKTKWEQRVLPMMSDQTFAPRPGPYCRWCAFSNEKGGPCQY